MTLRTKYAGNLANLDPVKDYPSFWLGCGDISDEALVNELFEQERFDSVVHFAMESRIAHLNWWQRLAIPAHLTTNLPMLGSGVSAIAP